MQELVSRHRPFGGLSDFQVMLAVTQGEVPLFPPRPDNEPSTIRDMFEKTCRRCWTNDPALRPAMRDIVGDLRPETWFLQEDESLERPIHIDEIPNLGRAL